MDKKKKYIYIQPQKRRYIEPHLLLTSGRGGGPSSKILLRMGIRKAAVFPEPEIEVVQVIYFFFVSTTWNSHVCPLPLMVNSSYQKGCSIYLITVFHGIAIVVVSSCINLTSLGTCHQVPLLLHNRYGILLNWSGLGVISQLQIKSK